MKKALFLYYSQAGQTQRAMETLAKGFREHFPCDVVRYRVAENFAFPWRMAAFFRVFPRSVLGLAPRLEPLPVKLEDYDLIFLGGQVWFLSPSLPVHSFLQSQEFRALQGKKVVVVLTCRNLWFSAMAEIRGRIREVGGELLGHITTCEISPLWASFVTTPRWMLTGKKEAFGFFPPAGIRETDFQALEDVGRKLGEQVSSGTRLDENLMKSNLDRISLRLMDRIGKPVFRFWARTIVHIAPNPGLWQDFWLIIFRINLVFLIVILAPYTKIIEALLAGWNSKAPATLKD